MNKNTRFTHSRYGRSINSTGGKTLTWVDRRLCQDSYRDKNYISHKKATRGWKRRQEAIFRARFRVYPMVCRSKFDCIENLLV